MKKKVSRSLSLLLVLTMIITNLISLGMTSVVQAEEETYVETFDNFNEPGTSYVSGSFMGNNNITWNYVSARKDEGYSIDGKGMMLRNLAEGSKCFSESISGGISSFSVELKKAYTGAGNRQVELFINGESKGLSEAFDDTNVHTFTVDNINISGNIVIEIRNITSKQIVIDNITWTSYTNGGPGEDPVGKVANVTASPSSGEVEVGTLVTLSTATEDAIVHYAVYADSIENPEFKVYDAPIEVNESLTIKAYATKEEMEDSDISEFIYTIEEPVVLEDIATAKAKPNGEEVIVQGIVTGRIGNNAFIQDETAGIYLYNSSTNIAELVVGNIVQVKGTLDEYNNLKQLKSVTVLEVASTGNELPEPIVVTIQEVTEELESQLIKIENLTLTEVPEGKESGYSIKASDGTNTMELRVDSYIDPKIPSSDFNVGDQVTVTAPLGQFRTTYQLMIRSINDIAFGLDTIAPTITHTPVTEGNTNEDLIITTTVTDNRKVESVKLNYKAKGADTYLSVDMILAENEYSYTIPKESITTAGIEYYIEASDGTNTATSPEDISVPYEITISDEDILPPAVTNLTPVSGSTTGDNYRPEISAEYSDDSGINIDSIKLYLDEIEVTDSTTITETKIIYTPTTDLTEGNHIARLEVSDNAPIPQTAIVEWNFYVGEREYNLYFGQLHSHTNLSDGQGTLTDAFTWARDEGEADFFAVTDHSNSFDNDTGNENITDVSQSTSTEWKQLNNTADSFNVDGEFVAIAGFEMTWSGSTGGWGHINTFNTPWFASRNNKSMDLQAYYEHIATDTDSISQLNHPGTTFGDFADFGFYSEAVDNVVHLIEVGNGEGPIRGSGYFPSYEYYTRALDKGWHVAPSNNQDNHKAGWITANEARTVVLAPELTRESIFEAIRNRNVYSTEDRNLEIIYTVNGNIMGSMLDDPDSLSIAVGLYDPDENDAIGKVTIISNGGVEVASNTFNDNEALWELELDPQYNYYYVRVDQKDKDIAVTAPVWTSEVTAVGISKVGVSQDPQIVNKPIEISATVYNNDNSALNNVLVEFFKDSLEGEKIGYATIDKIDPGKAEAATVEWTSNSVGNYKIYAKTVINIDGVDKVFSGSTSVTYANPEDVIKVVLDMAHYNAYISGDYAGKDLTLRQIFRDRKYMLVENHDELTAEDLEGAQLLIITDPQGTDNPTYNLQKSKFTAEEIAAIAEYTDNGGSLIICSKADYKDGTGEYSNGAQLNPILEAVGTNLRVNDDEVVDEISNGGQEYRLYFDRYVSTKYNLTDSIPEGTTYSFYSGCSVILKEDGSEEAVDWLVKGHETTGTIDSDYHGDNVPVEQGNVNAIGAEELPSGAKIIVAGTIFFSDFETASGDNMYSNKQITENILDWMIQHEEVELKTIAEVRADDNNDGIPDLMGQKFTIEGRITSESVAYTNANGRNNAFFDVIYVQDETGGITVFGVAETPLPLGVRVRVTGIVDQYDGDAELSIENELNDVVIIDDNIVPIEPIIMSTGDSMLEENEGWLVKIQGTVTRMTENSLYLDDGTGEARVYVNGYIGDGTGNPDMKGKWDAAIAVGDTVSAIGLASEDPEGHRLRVRNTGEIVKIETIDYPVNIGTVKTSDIDGNSSTEFELGNMVMVNTVITNNINEEQNCIVIIKFVDSEDRTYAIGFMNGVELEVGGLRVLSMGFNVNGVSKGTHTAKVYVWNNFTDKAPLSEVGIVEFTVK